MSRGRLFRTGMTIALLFGVIASVIGLSGPGALREALSNLVLTTVLAVVVFLACGMLLSSLRLKLITTDLGYPLTFREAVATLSLSQLAGALFFQLAGQLIARGALLSQQGIPAAATIVISSYERAVALSVSLVLAGCGAIYLFGTLSFDLQTGGYSLVKLVIGLIAAVAAGALFAWGGVIAQALRNMTFASLLRLLRSLLISSAIQLTTLAAYVVVEKTLAPEIDLMLLAAASCVIMLAASLPISLGGWGLREMSAVVALQAIGLSSASALVVAVLIGLMSLTMLGATALFLTISGDRTEASMPAVGTAMPDYGAILDWTLPIMAATAVFFQIYLPTAGGKLNVNLADPVVLLAAALFAIRYARKAWPQWRIPELNVLIGLASAVIAISFLHGWMRFGWTDWAFMNKTMGWFVLLAYGATGALIVHRAGEHGMGLMLTTFVSVGITLAMLDVSAILLLRAGVSSLSNFADPQISSFLQNPNAFGFALLLALAAVLSIRMDERCRAAVAAITVLGIWFTGSRSAIGTAFMLLIFAWMLGIRGWTVVRAVLGVVAYIVLDAALTLLPNIIHAGPAAAIWSFVGSAAVSVPLRSSASSDMERMFTLTEGIALFLANPIWGAGLGAFMQARITETGQALVIHSTPVWLLAEMGLVGFTVFAAAAVRIAWPEFGRRDDMAARLILLSLFAFASMATVHEMLYQRSLWLILGAALALPAMQHSSTATKSAR